jgi:hypothetical protein
MSAPSQDPNGSPNRLLVAIVAPFYIAWIALRAAIAGIARGLDAAWSAVLSGMSWVLRPIRSVLGLIGRVLATVGRAFAWVLALNSHHRAIHDRSGSWRQGLAALLRTVGLIVAPALQAVGAASGVLRGIGGLVRIRRRVARSRDGRGALRPVVTAWVETRGRTGRSPPWHAWSPRRTAIGSVFARSIDMAGGVGRGSSPSRR